MARPERRKLERVQYWQGQMLRAQDFLNLQGVEAQRRWWHNRAIHNAYGVAEGLVATLVPTSAPTGVGISPGVAYDIFGRELILERAETIPLPNNIPTGRIGAVSLLMRYKPPSRRIHPDEITEVCWTAHGSVIAGTAEFVWKLGDNLNPAEGVAVYAIYYAEPWPTIMPDPNCLRISAEPLSRPLLASGATIPGQTPWEQWTVGFTTVTIPGDGTVQCPALAGVQTWVDTSAAGFTDCPCYFAWLQGPLWSSQPQLFLPALLTNIADASISGFMFQLVLPGLGNPVLTLMCPTDTAYESVQYSSALVAMGGVPPYTFSIINGTLPPGLSLNTSTGAITGTPTASNTYPFTAQVVDSTRTSTTVSCSIMVTGGLEIARPVIVRTVPSDLVTANDFNQFAQQQGLYVSWIGCQMPGKACSCSQQGSATTQSSTPA